MAARRRVLHGECATVGPLVGDAGGSERSTVDGMDLAHEMTLHIQLSPDVVSPGAGPFGTRMVVPLATGTVKGDRISGTLHGGADWLLLASDGYGRVDVRCQIVTDDGAAIYAQYHGVLEMNAKSGKASLDPTLETEFDDQYFRIAPRFETGDPRYSWLNTTLFVGRGRIATDGVEYEIYRV
jgi:hypothetical protein